MVHYINDFGWDVIAIRSDADQGDEAWFLDYSYNWFITGPGESIDKRAYMSRISIWWLALIKVAPEV